MRFQFQPAKMDNTDMTTHFEKRHVCGWSFPLLPVGVSWPRSSRIQRFIWYVHARLQYCDRYLAREQFWNPNLVPIILHASLNKSKLLISRVMQTTCMQRQRTGAGWWAQTSVKQELCAGLQPALRCSCDGCVAACKNTESGGPPWSCSQWDQNNTLEATHNVKVIALSWYWLLSSL